jgi:hypothetical protein
MREAVNGHSGAVFRVRASKNAKIMKNFAKISKKA